MVEISILYYVYNNQIFLKESLDSIVNQSFKNTEIICVNANSTDNSLKILEEYQKEYDNIIVENIDYITKDELFSQTFESVNGKYVYITSPASILAEDSLHKLYDKAEEALADITVSDVQHFNQTDNYSKSVKECFGEVYDEILTYENIPDLMNIDYTTENKLYLTSFIKENDSLLTLDEKSFVHTSIFCAKTIAYIHEILVKHDDYYTLLTEKNDSRLFDTIPFSNYLIKLFKEYNLFDKYKFKLYDYKMYTTLDALNKIQERYKEEYFNKLREDFKQIVLNEDMFEDFIENIIDYYHKAFEQVIISENYYEYELLKKTTYEMDTYYRLLDDRNFYRQVQEKIEHK